MTLCEFYNQTLGSIKQSVVKEIIDIKNENQFDGYLGICLDLLLCPLAKRRCRIVGAPIVGERYPNGTYSGKKKTFEKNNCTQFYIKCKM